MLKKLHTSYLIIFDERCFLNGIIYYLNSKKHQLSVLLLNKFKIHYTHNVLKEYFWLAGKPNFSIIKNSRFWMFCVNISQLNFEFVWVCVK